MDNPQLPAESVAQCATAMASRSKSIASIFLFLDVIFVVGAIAMAAERTKEDWASTFFGMLFWVGLLSLLGIRMIFKARKATQLARRAISEPNLRWYLNNKMIVGATETGAPSPDLSFKITSKLVTVLTAVPRAHVVQRSI